MSFPDRRTTEIFLTVLFFLVLLTIVYAARRVIIIFIFAILFAYLINPVVRFLQSHSLFFKDLRGPHIVEAYLACIILVGLMVHALAPGLFKDKGRYLTEIPASVDRIATGEIAADIGARYGWSQAQELRLKVFLAQHQDTIRGLVGAATVAATALISALLVVPILAIFFLSGGADMTRACIQLFSRAARRESVQVLADEINTMLKSYIRAKVILAGLSFLFYSVAMLALGFPHAILLAVLGGVLEFIPILGWMTSAVTFLAIGSLAHAHWIWMAALIALWRLTMDYFIAPRVVGENLEIHPLIVIFGMMVGGAVGGIVGIYLSIPLLAVLRVIWRRSRENSAAEDAYSLDTLRPQRH
jgi:predicted PurR-regulated permease PerM